MVHIDKNSSRAYYEQLVLGIKEDILHGILQPGDKIPSVREMAKQLLMNPNTISKAYKVLETEKVLVIEARHLQISQSELIAWIYEAEKNLGGLTI